MTDQKNTPRFLERYQEKVLKYYSKKFPTLFHICFDPAGSHRKSRAAFGFLLGLILALFLYLFIIRDLQLSNYVSFICGVTLVFLLTAGCSLSSQFRCICLLSIPGFFGKAGRSVLKTLIIGYVIGGPIFNLTLNGKEVMRSFGCTAQLTYNLTKTKYDLMFAPFKKAMSNMNESAADIKKTISSVNELLEPIAKEIEGEDDLQELMPDNETTVTGDIKWENLTSLADELKRKNLTNLTEELKEQNETDVKDEDEGGNEMNYTDEPKEENEANHADEPKEENERNHTDELKGENEANHTDEPKGENEANHTDEPKEENEASHTEEPKEEKERNHTDELNEENEANHTGQPEGENEANRTDEPEGENERNRTDENATTRTVELRGLRGRRRRSDEVHDKEEREKAETRAKGEYYEAKYRKKITARCKHELERGSHKCRQNFAGAYKKCSESVTWIAGWMLCWPMKLTFVCNLVQALGGESICNPDGKIDVGIGEGYSMLKETRDKLNESLKDAEVKVKIDPQPLVAGLTEANRAAAGVVRDFEARKRFLNELITLIKRCLSFIFIKIIFDAIRYHHKYLADIEFDNVYVTPYFRKIDARRKARGSATLLPLKKLERRKLVDPYGMAQSKAEKRNILGQSAKLVLEIVTVSTFVVLDRLLYEVLDVVRTHGHLEISQEGHHNISLEIWGDGLVASLIRSLIKGFNVRRRVKNLVSNEPCLPRASRVSSWILWRIYLSYLAVWLMLLLQAYIQRARRLVAGYFYRKREKRRVLYLYNETLRRRVGFLRFARARLSRLAREHPPPPEPRLWLRLRLELPRLFGWLGRFECARRECALCGDREARHGPAYQLCPSLGCPGLYCPECWADVGHACLACSAAATSEEDATAGSSEEG